MDVLDGLGTFAAVGSARIEALDARDLAEGLRHDLYRPVLYAGRSRL